MKKIYKWVYAMIFAVSLYSCIRWVTDYTKEGHYWTQSLGNSILEIVILAFVSYLFFIYFRWQIEKSRRAKEPNRWKFVWRSYGMPFLLIILGVNATLAITRIFTGDAFHMVCLRLWSIMFSELKYWIKITPSSVSNWKRSRMINYRRN